MKEFLNRSLIYCVLLAVVSSWPVFAQMTTTGAIEGTVMDQSCRAMPAAEVTLTNESTKDVRSISSSETGAFTFGAAVPGSYTVKDTHTGFKIFERPGVVVSANERVFSGEIQLQVGSVGETVFVSAEAAVPRHREVNDFLAARFVATFRFRDPSPSGRTAVLPSGVRLNGRRRSLALLL